MSPSKEEALSLYHRMLMVRRFEKKIEFLFTRGQVHGTCHFSIGQEASSVGVCAALQPGDVVMSTHRGHGHALAKGLPADRLFGELLGKVNGFCAGRGGTQHVMSWEHSFIANGITGGTAVTGTGIALAFSLKPESQRSGNKSGNQNNRIVVSFSGDGAINEGHYHEALNLAAVWKLPIIFVCENNLYAMSTHTRESMVIQDIYLRAESYGMKTCCVNGNDVELVRETVRAAREHVLSGKGPVFIECKTYRFSGHSKNDQFLYRTREEEAQWIQRDPLQCYELVLRQRYGLEDTQLHEIQHQVDAELDLAAQIAERSPFPDPETIIDNLWCDSQPELPSPAPVPTAPSVPKGGEKRPMVGGSGS